MAEYPSDSIKDNQNGEKNQGRENGSREKKSLETCRWQGPG